ncbi:MAG: PD-(D/E)XK nuclease family protein [bacterium]|nr:PD-(D/E)XK nuclease family protein [bacterium]
MEAHIETLRSSPLFQLSLTSKELFHSNFLAWLFEMYRKESGQALSRFLKDGTDNVAIEGVLREHNHHDLTISFKNGQELIIENKVKSLPYIEQLAMYSEDAKANQNFLLLSLVPPPFAREGKIQTGSVVWSTLTYSDLAAIIEQIGSSIKNEYHRAMLSDYAAFIASLGSIFASDAYDENELFADFHSPSEGSLFEKLRPLRMGDIYQKLRYESFAGHIREALMQKYSGPVSLSGSHIEDGQVGHTYIIHGFTHTTGLVSVSYVLAKGLYLTVQIQGDSYRQMVQGYAGYGSASRAVAEGLKEKHLWFDFSNFAAAKEYPRGAKVFNTYTSVDYYRSVKLAPAFTVKDVIGFVVLDMERIEKSNKQITAVVHE